MESAVKDTKEDSNNGDEQATPVEQITPASSKKSRKKRGNPAESAVEDAKEDSNNGDKQVALETEDETPVPPPSRKKRRKRSKCITPVPKQNQEVASSKTTGG